MASAPPTTTAQEQPRAVKPRTLVGSTMPYVAAAIFAAGIMAWYFFVYVPAKLDYFVGLRFRTLAVAGAQVASKEENLFKALKGAVAAGGGKSGTVAADVIRGYFRALVPDMQFSRVDEAGLSPENIPGLRLSLTAGARTVGTTVAWEDVAAAATEASVRDFDDLILADENGVVVWQREKATPRVDNLETLLNTEAQPAGWFSFSWQVRPTQKKAQPVALPANPALSPVEVGGVPSYLFVQRVTLPKGGPVQLPTLYVGGLVSRRALERQASHIPVVWIVFVTLPVVLLFLALPFIKLASLMPKERYAFVDVAFLGLATIWAAGIGASLPFGPAGVTEQGDRRLATAADAIEGRLALETRRVLKLARTIQDHEEELKAGLDDCGSRIEGDLPPKRCGLWNAVRGMKQQLATGGVSERDLDEILGSLELDVVAWVNHDGQQVQKWTTKTVVTTFTSHRSFDHFRNLSLGHTWMLAAEDQPRTLPRFTIDPLRSPTTAEMGFIFGVPATGASHRNQFFVLNVRPQSVVDPILPPGYGFAVLTQDGRVQFHSEEALSLKENFLEEVNNPGPVRTWLQSGHQVIWSGDYHGRPHRLHIRSMPAFVGCQWRIVVFREMEPVLAAQLRQQTGTLRLWSLNFLALVGVLGLVWWHSRASSRRLRDIVLAPASPSRPGLSTLIGLTGLAVFLIAWTYRADAIQGLDYLYAGFALIPLLAVGAAVVSRHWEACLKRSIGARWSIVEVLLLLLLVGVLPAIGFARIANLLQDASDTAAWLETAAGRWETRRVRVLDRVSGPAYREQDRAAVAITITSSQVEGSAKKWMPPGRTGEEREPLFSYLAEISGATLGPSDTESSETDSAGARLVHFLVTWAPYRTKDLPGTPAPTPTRDGSLLQIAPHDSEQSPMLSAALESGVGPASLPKLLTGIAILACAALALCWARRKLRVPCFIAPPTLQDQMTQLLQSGADAILLVGPPRTRKDEAVCEAIKAATGKPPAERVPLLDRKKDADNDADVKRINSLAREDGGAKLAPDGRLWIHISNLEAQLTNATARENVLKLLEQLRDSRDGAVAKVLVVTTSIDPIANFEEVFDTERKHIYDDAVPEIGLARSLLVLSRFRRCYVRILCERSAHARWQSWLNYEPAEWLRTLLLEADGYEPLVEIADELASCQWPDGNPSLDELARAFTARAQATYQLLWTSCTRSEKLVLIQLAQEGLVNPKCHDIVARLMAKGLLVSQPGLTVFNYTFRRFLREIERDHVVTEWERMEGTGLWVTAGRLVGSSLLAGGLFFLLTQDLSVQSLLPIVSGTGVFGLPIVRELLARFSGGSSAGPRAA